MKTALPDENQHCRMNSALPDEFCAAGWKKWMTILKKTELGAEVENSTNLKHS